MVNLWTKLELGSELVPFLIALRAIVAKFILKITIFFNKKKLNNFNFDIVQNSYLTVL